MKKTREASRGATILLLALYYKNSRDNRVNPTKRPNTLNCLSKVQSNLGILGGTADSEETGKILAIIV